MDDRAGFYAWLFSKKHGIDTFKWMEKKSNYHSKSISREAFAFYHRCKVIWNIFVTLKKIKDNIGKKVVMISKKV